MSWLIREIRRSRLVICNEHTCSTVPVCVECTVSRTRPTGSTERRFVSNSRRTFRLSPSSCLRAHDPDSYVHAESDATNAYEDGKAAQPVAVKALYRRAQARRYLGKFTEAKDGELIFRFDLMYLTTLYIDLQRALELSPNETSLLSEEAELRKIQDKTPEELQTWLMKSKGVKLPMEGMKAKRVLEEAEKLRSLVEFGPVN